jgi:hypothetical protein
MRFSADTLRNSAFPESFLERYRKQKLNKLSATHWLDEVGDYSGTQRNKYVLESDGTAVINSSHITSQTVTSKKGTATATVTTGQITIGSGWISEVVLSDGTIYFLEESSGTNFYDSSGAGNDATLTGTGTWAIKRDLTLINNANILGYSKGFFIKDDSSSSTSVIPVMVENDVLSFRFKSTNTLSVVVTTTVGSVQYALVITQGSFTSQRGDLASAYKIDGQVFTDISLTRGLAYTLLSDGLFHEVEITFNSNVNGISGLKFGGYSGAVLTDTSILDVKINGISIPNQQIIPRDDSDITKDVFNSNLQFVGRVASDMKFIESNCIQLNGTDGYGQGDFAIAASSNYEISFFVNVTSNNNVNFLIDGRNGSNGFGVALDSINSGRNGKLIMIHNSASIETLGTNYDNGKTYFIVAKWNGTVITLEVYDENKVIIETVTGSNSTTISDNNNFKIGRSNIAVVDFAPAKFFGLEITLDGVKKSFPIAEGSGVTSFGFENSSNDINWVGGATWSTQDAYHHNLTQGFSLVGSVKLPYKISGAYSNEATNGHNEAETTLKQVVFREDFGASSLHFDQSDLSSEVIAYADIENTDEVFVDAYSNVKINLETFSPNGIINQSNRENNGLRNRKNTLRSSAD